MEKSNKFKMSREKHLDHMVRVVPFIVFCYAIQCFVILKISPTEFSSVSLSILGGFLATMITGFITYDLKHQAIFYEHEFHLSFFSKKETVSYDDITLIEIRDPGESFSTLIFHTTNGKRSFYFVDDAEKIKNWIESKRQSELLAA